jgi:DnaK suppressor protein
MATAAKKPTPKTQKAASAKAASKKPAAELVAVSEKNAPDTQVASNTKPSSPAEATPGTVLTDEDILRMPEKDYMNEVQLQFFKAKLLAMRAEILDNARETGEHLKENEVFADPNDRATVEEENMLEQRVRDRERKLLKKIEQSLARIESGEYGYCLETGEPIGIPRLLARPTAELSIEAQEKHERMERLYAD